MIRARPPCENHEPPPWQNPYFPLQKDRHVHPPNMKPSRHRATCGNEPPKQQTPVNAPFGYTTGITVKPPNTPREPYRLPHGVKHGQTHNRFDREAHPSPSKGAQPKRQRQRCREDTRYDDELDRKTLLPCDAARDGATGIRSTRRFDLGLPVYLAALRAVAAARTAGVLFLVGLFVIIFVDLDFS